MKPAMWRAPLLMLCALAAILTLAAGTDYFGLAGSTPWAGNPGTMLGASSEPYRALVLTVDPGGPADRAGLHSGDRVDIRSNTLLERLQLFNGFPTTMNGRPVTLLVHRGARQERVTIVPVAWDPARYWYFFVSLVGLIWLTLFAALIAWRGAYAPANLMLSTVLVSIALGGLGGTGSFALPWVWAYVCLFILGALAPVAVALWAVLASGFTQPLSRPRRVAQWLCFAFVATALVIQTAQFVGISTLWSDPMGPFFARARGIPMDAAILMAFVCSALAIRASHGVERQRAAWSLVSLSLFFGTLRVGSIAAALQSSYAAYEVWVSLENLNFFVMPVVLTYVALNRRLIDIGFVLSRTAVFAILSTLVIGAFVLAEWAATEWLVNASHTTGAIVGTLVALGLGFSLRYIHKYVDRFVDQVFFRKRHEDEAALRRFAHEASYISDRSVLLERAVREVREHANVDAATILVRDGAASYVSSSNGERAAYSENDPLIVTLRAWTKAVDLHDIKNTELRGEVAFPMVSRGVLVGVLVCGPKRDGQSYAPDESDALLALAHGVGTALDTLSSPSDGAVESLQDILLLIVDKLEALPSRLSGQSLPPTAP
jgi:hypothetical protein